MGGHVASGSAVLLALAAGWPAAAAGRPGPGDRYDDGAELRSAVSDAGRFRVWYVTEGADAVPAGDTAPANGVPDFVDEVAAVAERSHDLFVVERGFRAPLVDTDYLPADQAGGDERYDIYLLVFGQADGSHEVDACDADSDRCAGHMLMENDFQGASYESLAIAIRVVTSHEYFHAIQGAYDVGQDIKWSEGTAVWAEEQAFPEQDDYEALLSHFLARPFRAFDRPSGASFGDLYPYGAALWPTYLAERHDPDIVRRIWEACEGGVGFLDAAGAVLEAEHGTSLAQAWREFTWWNLFTAERADGERAYAHGGDWPSVALEPALAGEGFEASYWIEGLSARYVPITLPEGRGTPRAVRLVTESGAPVTGTGFLWDGRALGEPMPFVAADGDPGHAALELAWDGAPTLFVVLTGETRGAPMRSVSLSLDESGAGGCHIAPARGSGAGGGLLCLLGMIALRALRRGRVARPGSRRALSLAVALLAGIVVLAGPRILRAQPGDPAAPQDADQSEQETDEPIEVRQEEIIVVTGSRAERPLTESTVATEVITRADIEASGATTVAEVLEEHPGVEVYRALRGSAVRMQGLDPTYVAVLVDGQRAIGRLDGAIDLERIPVQDIERIEIVKGASSALYGSDALAGVVNIITREPERPIEARVEARYGSLDTLDLSAGLGFRTRGWHGQLSTGWHRGDGYDLSPEDVATTGDGFDHRRVAARVARATDRVELTATAEYLLRYLRGVDVRAGATVFDHENAIENAAASLAARWRPAERASLRASARYSLYRDQRLDDQRGTAAGDTYEETNERLAEVLIQYDDTIARRHLITLGVEGGRESLAGARIREDARERYRVAAFAQDEWLLSSAPLVHLALGGRLDLDTQFGAHAVPKLALRWDPHERVTTRASYGWGYRAPSFKELYLAFDNAGVGYRVDGNPALDPETSRSVNLGVELRAHRRAWASVSVYYNDIQDLITVDLVETGDPGAPDRFGYVNAESAYTRGLESALRVEPIDGLTARLGYTFTDTRDRDAARALPGRARHRAALELGYARGSTRGSVRAGLAGERVFFRDMDGAYETIRAAPYATVDARVEHEPSARVSLFAGVENLLDEGEPLYLPIAPRTFYAGASATY